jgi:hypothetical protein
VRNKPQSPATTGKSAGRRSFYKLALQKIPKVALVTTHLTDEKASKPPVADGQVHRRRPVATVDPRVPGMPHALSNSFGSKFLQIRQKKISS